MEEQVIDYTIVESANSRTVIQDVKNKMKDGWELYGDLTAMRGSNGSLFAQAMVKFGQPGGEEAVQFGYKKVLK